MGFTRTMALDLGMDAWSRGPGWQVRIPVVDVMSRLESFKLRGGSNYLKSGCT